MNWSLFSSAEWWLPYDACFVFRGQSPVETELTFGTSGLLKTELEVINQKSWNADEATILSWEHTESYPADGHMENGVFFRDAANPQFPVDSRLNSLFPFCTGRRSFRWSTGCRSCWIIDERTMIKMKCEYCKELSPVNGFGGYLHYASSKRIIDEFVKKGLWEETHSNSFESYYRCIVCNAVWVLAGPDFPVTGYLIQK